MPIKCEFKSGNLGVYTVSGKLGQAEYQKAQQDVEAVIQQLGSVRILIVLEGFTGWERAEGWEDLSFAERNDPYIEKIAIVGDPQWQDLVYAFTLKGLRPVPIEYFNTDEESRARDWLEGSD
ncbi:MAG: STAS/SEC14 domain-containing protein [Gammaproteobacteria bacterium]